MSQFNVSVIDQSCENTDQSFFPPKVTMTTKSTTQIATVLGFSEYPGFVSNPPKKYRRLTWTGSSEQTLFVQTTQIAGARIDYDGATEIGFDGSILSDYSKNLSEMCAVADNLCMGIGATGSNPIVAIFNIAGWNGPTGSTLCPPPTIPYTPQGDQAIKTGPSAIFDSTPFSSGINFGPDGTFIGFNKTFQINSATTAFDFSSGQQNALNVLTNPVPCGTILTPSAFVPPEGFQASLIWNHNYDATLDEEYTDADALANADVIQGNGAVAQNIPRTTGFTSTFTNVIFTLSATNLISGQTYTISVDFADLTAGTVSTKQYGIVGDTTMAHTLTDIIPTPIAGHTVQVRNPRIAFAE